MNLYIDIETTPTARADVRDYIAATVSPPGNISKAETIAKWNEESRPAAVAEAVAKTGLDGSFGRVCVIGYAVEDRPSAAVYHADDEGWLLHEFAANLSELVRPSDRHTTCIIGHNVSAFDLRFLTQRFIVHGIKPPMVIARAARAKPWEDQIVFDTMIQWAGVGKSCSLDKLCMALSIPSPKGELDGSKVWEYVQAGRVSEVADYCRRDVDATRAVHRRMTFADTPVAVPQFEDVAA